MNHLMRKSVWVFVQLTHSVMDSRTRESFSLCGPDQWLIILPSNLFKHIGSKNSQNNWFCSTRQSCSSAFLHGPKDLVKFKNWWWQIVMIEQSWHDDAGHSWVSFNWINDNCNYVNIIMTLTASVTQHCLCIGDKLGLLFAQSWLFSNHLYFFEY